MIWWVVIFTILPLGVQRESAPLPGHDHGAPKKHHLPLKILITTVLSTLIWFGADYLIRIRFIPLDVM